MDNLRHSLLNICRICESNNNLMNLFTENNKWFIWKIQECSNVTIDKDDNLPQMICDNCIEHLEIAYAFKTQCEYTDQKFRLAILMKNKTKPIQSSGTTTGSGVDHSSTDEPFTVEIHTRQPINERHVLKKQLQINKVKISPVTSTVFSTNTSTTTRTTSSSTSLTTNRNIDRNVNNNERNQKNIQLPTDNDGDVKVFNLESIKQEENSDSIFDDEPIDDFTYTSNAELLLELTKDSINEQHLEIEYLDYTGDYSDDNNNNNNNNNYNEDDAIECELNDVSTEDEFNGNDTKKIKINVSSEIDAESDDDDELKHITYEIDDDIDFDNIEQNDDVEDEKKIDIDDEMVQLKSDSDGNVISSTTSVTQTKRTLKRLSPKKSNNKINRNNLHSCKICGEKFRYLIDYHQHIYSHKQDDDADDGNATDGDVFRYACHKCDKRYKHKNNLKRHINITHEKMRIPKNHICEICGKGFSSRRFLAQHMYAHVDEKNFKCEICGKFFKCELYVQLHKRTHFKGKESDIPDVYKRYRTQKIHKCEECGKCLSNAAILRIHMRTHTGETPYECIICKRKFKHYSALQSHTLMHLGEKPFECNVCGTKFRQKAHLNTHSKVHTGERNFMCNICSKTFSLRGNLKVHMRLHNEESQLPYECDNCGTQFISKNMLKLHGAKCN